MKKKLALVLLMLMMIAVFSGHAFAKDKKVKLATLNWSPYYGSNLKNDGYLTELTKKAFEKVGYEVEVDFMKWKRAINMARLGKYDGVLGAYHSDKRAESFVFSDEISAAELVFFARKDSEITDYDDLKDLKEYQIGIVKGYSYGNKFDSADYLNKQVVDNLAQNLEKLIHGRVELIAQSKKVLFHKLNNDYSQYKGKLKVINPPIKVNPLYNLFSKQAPDYKQKVKDFNRGLKMLKEDGTYDEIMEKHGF